MKLLFAKPTCRELIYNLGEVFCPYRILIKPMQIKSDNVVIRWDGLSVADNWMVSTEDVQFIYHFSLKGNGPENSNGVRRFLFSTNKQCKDQLNYVKGSNGYYFIIVFELCPSPISRRWDSLENFTKEAIMIRKFIYPTEDFLMQLEKDNGISYCGRKLPVYIDWHNERISPMAKSLR